MKRMLVLLWVTCASVWAVGVGDSQQTVKAELGRPVSVRKEGTVQVYRYGDGMRVSFESGVVVSVVDAGGKVLAGQLERQSEPRVETKPVLTKPQQSVQRDAVEQVRQPVAVRELPNPVREEVHAREASGRGGERVKADAFPLLAVVGMGLLVIFQVWFIIEAFAESALWGVGVMFVPVVSLIFTIAHWERAKKPFLLTLFVATPLIIFAGLNG